MGGGYGKKPPKWANEKASPLIHSFSRLIRILKKSISHQVTTFLVTCEIAHLNMISGKIY